jgi:hypothetical protein
VVLFIVNGACPSRLINGVNVWVDCLVGDRIPRVESVIDIHVGVFMGLAAGYKIDIWAVFLTLLELQRRWSCFVDILCSRRRR